MNSNTLNEKFKKKNLQQTKREFPQLLQLEDFDIKVPLEE
jgi:hypothetical protein